MRSAATSPADCRRQAPQSSKVSVPIGAKIQASVRFVLVSAQLGPWGWRHKLSQDWRQVHVGLVCGQLQWKQAKLRRYVFSRRVSFHQQRGLTLRRFTQLKVSEGEQRLSGLENERSENWPNCTVSYSPRTTFLSGSAVLHPTPSRAIIGVKTLFSTTVFTTNPPPLPPPSPHLSYKTRKEQW